MIQKLKNWLKASYKHFIYLSIIIILLYFLGVYIWKIDIEPLFSKKEKIIIQKVTDTITVNHIYREVQFKTKEIEIPKEVKIYKRDTIFLEKIRDSIIGHQDLAITTHIDFKKHIIQITDIDSTGKIVQKLYNFDENTKTIDENIHGEIKKKQKTKAGIFIKNAWKFTKPILIGTVIGIITYKLTK